MKYVGKNGLRVEDKKVWHEGNFNPSSKSNTGHTHPKSQITDMPTKLSQFQNDIGAGAGLNIVTSSIEPTGLNAGDWWYKET